MAVLFIFFNILILFVSVVLADVDDSTTTEIFNRLDELGRKVTSLENKNIALEHLIEKQNNTIEVLRSDLRKMQETLPQEDLILKNEIKILEYRKLGSLQKELLELEQKVVKNVTQSKLMLESQDAKWTQNFVSLNDTVTKIESNQSLIKATMDDRFTVLEETLALTPQHGDISQLESTLKSSVNKINGLENEVKTNKMALEFKIDSDVKEVKDSLVVTNTAVQEMDNKLNQKIGVLETELVNLQYTTNDTKDETPPSFYASMTTVIPIQGPHQRIVYDEVKTNNGNGYNESTGIFTVPESGTYVFTWTTFSYVEEYVRLEIVVAGTIFGGTLSDTQETGDADTETGIIVVNAQEGDQVFVRTQLRGPGNGRLYVEFECASTFSGWKIS